MIDPLEAILELAAKDAGVTELVEDRIAVTHEFGSEWEIPSKALCIRRDGGVPDLYTPRQKPRLEVRCYGESFHEASKVYQAMVVWLRSLDGRQLVQTSEGEALVYFLVSSSEPTMMVEDVINVPLFLFFCESAVAETATGG